MENRFKKISCEMTLSRRVKGEEHTSKYTAEVELSAGTVWTRRQPPIYKNLYKSGAQYAALFLFGLL